MRRVLLLSYLGLAFYVCGRLAWFASNEGVITEHVGRVAGFGFGLIPTDVHAVAQAQSNPSPPSRPCTPRLRCSWPSPCGRW